MNLQFYLPPGSLIDELSSLKIIFMISNIQLLAVCITICSFQYFDLTNFFNP